MIMCGMWDMGRKFFFCRTHFFSYPTPPRGVSPEKKISHPVSKIFFSPPPYRNSSVAHNPPLFFFLVTRVCKT